MDQQCQDIINKVLAGERISILFLHRNFPGQFRNLILELAKNPLNLIMFITCNDTLEITGVNKIIYKPKDTPENCHLYAKTYEESIIHAQSAADIAIEMKKRGIIPDIIYGHSWGSTMFMKDVFPEVPFLCYFEWFNSDAAPDINFDGTVLTEAQKSQIRCKNAPQLIDLYSCDAGISPTYWQREQFPKEFHNKIKVLHDGVNTDICKPDLNAKFVVEDKNLEFTQNDEVITYATSGMEPYRGFPQFMEAVDKLLKKRPNAHFIIGGEDKVFYGTELQHGTYKQLMLEKFDIDLNRVHFVGMLTFDKYVKLLQISSVHVYSTVPFVLSWSLLDAMACECAVVASNTRPVQEVMQDGYNGLLFDFYNVDQLVEKIEYALDNKDEIAKIKKNARMTILDKYSINLLLPQHIEYIKSLIHK